MRRTRSAVKNRRVSSTISLDPSTRRVGAGERSASNSVANGCAPTHSSGPFIVALSMARSGMRNQAAIECSTRGVEQILGLMPVCLGASPDAPTRAARGRSRRARIPSRVRHHLQVRLHRDALRLALARNAAEADVAGRGIDRLRRGGRPGDSAGNSWARTDATRPSGLCAVSGFQAGRGRSSAPRGRRADFWECSRALPASAECSGLNQSVVHSQTLPIMS